MRNGVLALLVVGLVGGGAHAQTCGSYYRAPNGNGNGNGNGGAYAYSPYGNGNGNGNGADVYDARWRPNGGGRPRVLEFRGSDGSYLRLELQGHGNGYRPAPNYYEYSRPSYGYPAPQYYVAPPAPRGRGIELGLFARGRCPTCP